LYVLGIQNFCGAKGLIHKPASFVELELTVTVTVICQCDGALDTSRARFEDRPFVHNRARKGSDTCAPLSSALFSLDHDVTFRLLALPRIHSDRPVDRYDAWSEVWTVRCLSGFGSFASRGSLCCNKWLRRSLLRGKQNCHSHRRFHLLLQSKRLRLLRNPPRPSRTRFTAVAAWGAWGPR
jgi:hypothetical protein